MLGLLQRLYSECLDITHHTERAQTDVLSVHGLPYDINIIQRSMIRVRIPVDFTLRGCTWARSVSFAQQAGLRRPTCVHDYEILPSYV